MLASSGMPDSTNEDEEERSYDGVELQLGEACNSVVDGDRLHRDGGRGRRGGVHNEGEVGIQQVRSVHEDCGTGNCGSNANNNLELEGVFL